MDHLKRSCFPFRFIAGTSLVGLGVLAPVLPFARSQSQEVVPVVRIEEDWVLELNDPDDTVDSPQFHTVMSPVSDLDGNYAQVLWNYREIPDFVGGGVQLQSYDGDYLIRTRSIESRQLSTSAETIRWSQALQTDGNVLSFEIFAGTSTTWGGFGRDMRIDENVAFNDLSGYSTETSATNACVTYGSNRVDLLKIIEVRYYAEDGTLIQVDSVPKIVYEYGEE